LQSIFTATPRDCDALSPHVTALHQAGSETTRSKDRRRSFNNVEPRNALQISVAVYIASSRPSAPGEADLAPSGQQTTMSINRNARLKIILSLIVVASGLFLLAGGEFAWAVEPASESQILNALKPRPLTRSLTGTTTQKNAKQQNLINSLRSPKTRSLTLDERNEVAAIAKERPSIDLEIFFDFDSADITPKAVPDLMSLGRALTNPELQGSVFLLGGHTDAKGGQEYNQRLSERRAQAVRDFLIQNFRIASDTLVAAGYGKEQLKNSADPFAAQNRRVQVTNLQTKQEAGK
jgi:outer membrane protein OmpA-like peptidoglycan-associated protein